MPDLRSRIRRTTLRATLAGALAVALAEPARAAAPDAPARVAADAPEASLPFASHSIRNWEADGNRGLWVEAVNGHWYYGSFNGACMGLQSGETLAFRFGPTDTLDRYSQVETHMGGPCWLRSFKASAAPPRANHAEPGKPASGKPASGQAGAGPG